MSIIEKILLSIITAVPVAALTTIIVLKIVG